MSLTTIEWTGRRRVDGTFEPGYSWSPWWGCTKVSAGCAHCYAAELAHRYRDLAYQRGVPRQLTKNWQQPLAWHRKAKRDGVRRKVFPSMCDVFDPEAPPAWRQRFFNLIRDTENLEWLLLTKRPEYIESQLHELEGWALSNLWDEWCCYPDNLHNVWLGVSVENQTMADQRIPLLLQTPAAVRFLSVEPLLGPVHLGEADCFFANWDATPGFLGPVDWVILGGESGPHRRPCAVAWIADLAAQCQAASVACFVKQDSALRPGQQGRIPDDLWSRKEFPS